MICVILPVTFYASCAIKSILIRIGTMNQKLNSQRMFRVKLFVAHPYKMNL